MPDYNKLRDALMTIKNECSSHKNSCSGCPLVIDSYTCGVTSERMVGEYDYRKKPQYWNIPEIHLMSKGD